MRRLSAAKINLRQHAIDFSITLAVIALATLLSALNRHFGLGEINAVVIYILSVLIVSRCTKGYAYGIVASFLAMLAFNFFFISPLYTFRIYNDNYIFTFIVMLVAAVITSASTSKLIRLKDLAAAREKQAQMMNRVTGTLVRAGGIPEIASVSAQCLSELLECDVVFLILPTKAEAVQRLRSEKVGGRVLSDAIPVDQLDAFLRDFYSIPVNIKGRPIGYLCLPEAIRTQRESVRDLLDSVVLQVTISMERELLTAEKEAARADTEREKFKSNLLRAISHDLRTPLAGITGSAEMLLHSLRHDENIKIVQGIYEDSRWLTLLVENVLSLTKIQEGRLPLNIRSEAVEEIVSESISRASKYTPNRRISTFIPPDVLFVPMDGKLIEQVLINLIDNALKHTNPNDEIKISVYQEKNKVWFEVSDNGEGIAEGDLPKIFDMFFISNRSRAEGKRGIVLGLAICKSIINFHGGEIYAENNPGGGVTFRFYLHATEDGVWH